jgi:hypothetical protein
MSMDPQMLAAMLMQGQQGQAPQQGALTPRLGAAGGIAQGGNDFLKMMMLRQMMQQRQGQPPQMQPPAQPQNQNPMIPPPQQPNPLQST